MQTLRPALVPLLLMLLCGDLFAAAPKTHAVTLGPYRRVAYTPPEATPTNKSEEEMTLRVRPLFVDNVQKEWTVGEIHDVTDRSFVVRRALRINDSLPEEQPRWTWQPGPWLMIDRITGHVTALHLPDFDPQVSQIAWFRDYAAYCGQGRPHSHCCGGGYAKAYCAEVAWPLAGEWGDVSHLREADMATHTDARDAAADRRSAADV
jgi:hypothetical protein